MERWVRRLTPPANREEVLGDLAERCRSPQGYLRDALRTVPFVVASRLRRTTHPLALLFGGAFLFWAVFWGNRQTHPLAALVPTLLVLMVFALRDVYRTPSAFARWWRSAACDTGLAVAAVLVWQLLVWWLAPALLLSRETLAGGFPLGMIILYFVRLQSPSGFQPPSSFSAQRLSFEELRTEIAVSETLIRRAVGIEIGACVFVCLCFLAYALWAPAPPVARLGFATVTAGAAFVGGFLWRHGRVRPIPAEAGFAATVQTYRSDLARRARLSRRYFWWYVLPLFAGPVSVTIGLLTQRPDAWRNALVTLAVFAAVGTLLTLVHLAMAAKMQKRAEQLQTATEKLPGEPA